VIVVSGRFRIRLGISSRSLC